MEAAWDRTPETAPKLGVVCTAIGAFSNEAKDITEKQMRALYDQLAKEGSIRKDSIFVKRIFGPKEAQAVAERLGRARVDAILILNSAFPNGHVFATLASDPYLRMVPIVVSSDREVDLKTREWTTNSWCGVIMNNFVAKRIRRYVRPLAGCPADKEYGEELRRLLKVYRTIAMLRKDYLGRIGEAPGGFHSASGDQFAFLEKFGTKVDTLDLTEVYRTFESGKAAGVAGKASFSDKDAASVVKDLRKWTAVCLGDADVRKLARMYLAFRSIVRANGYTSIAFRCWPEMMGGPDATRMTPCVVSSLLMGYGDVTAVGCESDWPMTVAGTMGTLLSGQPSACLDFVNVTGASDIIQLGHCGAGICGKMVKGDAKGLSEGNVPEGKPLENALFCQSPCKQVGNMLPGALIGQFEYGPKTGISLLNDGGVFKMLAFSGESSPETDRGVRYAAADVRVPKHKELHELILTHGFSHHLAVALADVTWELKELAAYYGLEFLTP